MVSDIKVSFFIPEWFPPDRFEIAKPIFFGDNHVYAGSFSHTEYTNTAVNALFKLKDVVELYNFFHVVMDMPINTKDKWIKDTENKLTRFFKRYKEYAQV